MRNMATKAPINVYNIRIKHYDWLFMFKVQATSSYDWPSEERSWSCAPFIGRPHVWCIFNELHPLRYPGQTLDRWNFSISLVTSSKRHALLIKVNMI